MCAAAGVIAAGIYSGLLKMNGTGVRPDRLTVIALALLAMCLVTFDHEALGHGSACLAARGRILLLTSSLFQCSARSEWIAGAGPAANLLAGFAAWMVRLRLAARYVRLRFFLVLVTAFSFFWEGGYLSRAMRRRDGDLYFFARDMLGNVTVAERWIFAALGLALFLFTIRLTAVGLAGLVDDAASARKMARTAWLTATIGAAAAAAVYRGHSWPNLRDAVLEIGLASFPLLFIPRRAGDADANVPLSRSWPIILTAAGGYILFVLTFGRGIPG